MDHRIGPRAAFKVRFIVLTVAVAVVAGCGGSGGLSGLGDDLPGCDSLEARQIAKSALMSHLNYSEGYNCFMEDNTWMEADAVGRAGFRPYPKSMADCKEAPNGRDFIPVRDFRLELKDYLVEAESAAQDGRSNSCEISTAYELGSGEQPQFSGPGSTRRLTIRYFKKTESGERRYESTVYRR